MVLSILLLLCLKRISFSSLLYFFFSILEIVETNLSNQKSSFFAAFMISNCSPCTSSICI